MRTTLLAERWQAVRVLDQTPEEASCSRSITSPEKAIGALDRRWILKPFEWMRPPSGVSPRSVELTGLTVEATSLELGITKLEVFPQGFLFRFFAETDVEPGRLCEDALTAARSAAVDPPDLALRIGVEFADGRRASAGVRWIRVHPQEGAASSDLPEHAPPDPRHDILLRVGGIADGGRRFDGSAWTWPLPPPGTLTFTLGWPAAGLRPSPVRNSAAAILSAAADAGWIDG